MDTKQVTMVYAQQSILLGVCWVQVSASIHQFNMYHVSTILTSLHNGLSLMYGVLELVLSIGFSDTNQNTAHVPDDFNQEWSVQTSAADMQVTSNVGYE